jgi:hypothetical protein
MNPAAAQIAVQSLPRLLLGRGGTVAQQARCGCHHAGGAVAALGGLLVDERLLDRMEPADSPSTVMTGPSTADTGRSQDERAWPSMSTMHAPHSPSRSRPRPGQGQVMAEHVE